MYVQFVSNPEVYFNFWEEWTSYLRDYFESLPSLLARASLPPQISDQIHHHISTTPAPEQMQSDTLGLSKRKTSMNTY